ncbi:MAG: hypothetical protein JWO25_1777 [Alphaproteobacteria bacterium]|nr:hypothetical protein [Alphaproteobacteria bacterium]MDB5719700.1 hypothetical protein [Alphaproteobacteria bacterium]
MIDTLSHMIRDRAPRSGGEAERKTVNIGG